MINICEKTKCSGCSACENVCPTHSICMKSDEEGFLYPHIDKTLCIECGRCERVCPVSNIEKCRQSAKAYKNAYIVQSKDKQVLLESTSGGAFSEVARLVLSKNGVVIGAALNENKEVTHKAVVEWGEIASFRNSKYTQSRVGSILSIAKDNLDKGNIVLFSGTPCQVEGLLCYLGHEYKNLITVDFACRGVPSPLLLSKYLKWISKREIVKGIKFRDKKYGYYSSMFSITYKNWKSIYQDIDTNPMLHFFFKGLCSRPICHECLFKSVNRRSDLTFFDCWHANVFDRTYGGKGATGIIVHTEKGLDVINAIKSNVKMCEIEMDKIVKLDGSMITKSVKPSMNRHDFFIDLNSQPFDYLVDKYIDNGALVRIKRLIKKCLTVSGFFNRVMKFRNSR